MKVIFMKIYKVNRLYYEPKVIEVTFCKVDDLQYYGWIYGRMILLIHCGLNHRLFVVNSRDLNEISDSANRIAVTSIN